MNTLLQTNDFLFFFSLELHLQNHHLTILSNLDKCISRTFEKNVILKTIVRQQILYNC